LKTKKVLGQEKKKNCQGGGTEKFPWLEKKQLKTGKISRRGLEVHLVEGMNEKGKTEGLSNPPVPSGGM